MKCSFIYILILTTLLSACSKCEEIVEVSSDRELSKMPVIGIMTQEVSSPIPGQPKNITYVPSTYVKFLESLGAVVIPIHYTYSIEQVEELMGKINGILFTGGDLNLTHYITGEYHRYTKLSDFIFKKAIEMNNEGTVFPLIGICQGHQLMMILQNGDGTVLKNSERWDKNDTLIFNDEEITTSKFMVHVDSSLIAEVEVSNFTYNIHHLGIYLEDFENNEKLNSFYSLLSTNIDDSGVEYISTTEAKKYPFFTTQYHPEKLAFQFISQAVPHSADAERFSMQLLEAFLDYARQNNNHLNNYDELMSRIIENSGHHTVIDSPPTDNYYFHSDFP